MPYPDRPTGPRYPWTPSDCAAGKAALVERFNEYEVRVTRAIDWLAGLANRVCADYEEVKARRLAMLGPPPASPCEDALKALCDRLRALVALSSQLACDRETAFLNAIDAIDCNQLNWRVAWLAASEQWRLYKELLGAVMSDFDAFTAEFATLKATTCFIQYIQPTDFPPDLQPQLIPPEAVAPRGAAKARTCGCS